jgi:hypothetical protein
MTREPDQDQASHDSNRPVRISQVRIIISPDDYSGAEEDATNAADFNSSSGDAPVYVHIYAAADLVVCGTGQLIASPGTWRVKADDSKEINAEARQAYDELVEILAALGIMLDRPFESVRITET